MVIKMINQLVSKIKKTSAPIVVGLDPMMKFVPEQVKTKAFDEFGETLEGAAEAIWQFNKEIVDNIYDVVPAVKPQIAMYEQFGIPGVMTFKKTIDYAKEKGLIVIGDIKRGDIGSTSEAYAAGHLGKVQVGSKSYYGFDEDFATLNPYMGSDSVKPFLGHDGKWVILLALTSNPGSKDFQFLATINTEGCNARLFEDVLSTAQEWGSNDEMMFVVGATQGEMFADIRRVAPEHFLLVPGVGAQGGDLATVCRHGMTPDCGLLVNSSRGIIFASKGEDFADAAAKAAQALASEMDGMLNTYSKI